MMIRSLEGVDFRVLAEGFAAAFADYAVAFPEDALRGMLSRRGFNPALSFGAFEGDRLVAFIFNGAGEWKGAPTVYDTGTGTLPEYRGRRLVGQIFEHSLPALRNAGVSRYLLEVLQQNQRAVRIYRGEGFGVTRDFDCFNFNAPAEGGDCIPPRYRPLPDGYSLVEISPLQFTAATEWEDFAPSWQNSDDSLRRSISTLVSFGILHEGEPVAHIIFEPSSGDIPRIAVHPAHRRRGLATQLVAALFTRFNPTSMKVINVEATCKSLPSFLISCGFTPGLSQYEMLLDL